MTIFIVGAGAIGKVLAVYLKLQGKDVHLIRGSVDDGSTYTETITVTLKDGSVVTAGVPFSTLRNFSALDGLVVLTNKSFGNAALAKTLQQKAQHAPIVLLQNGLGVEQPFLDHGFIEVFRCVLFATSQVITTYEVRYKPVAPSPIGVVKQSTVALADVVQALDTPAFRFVAEAAIERIVWKKAIANCVFNSICPLLEVDNGIFHRDAPVWALAQRIIAECLTIAHAKNITLEADEIEKQVIAISQASDGQFISTLQDIRNKKETEIDTLNLAIARMATDLQLAHEVPQTRLLGELIKMKSTQHR